MRLLDGQLRLSASDLMRFKGCRHATTLDLRLMEVGDIVPAADRDEAALLQRQGDAHELAFLDGLRASGRSIVEIPRDGLSLERSVELTREAMLTGPDVIFQGAMLGAPWGGYSDFLERVDRPSALGAWSYEVVDTKLKRKPDPKHVLQLSLYSDLLADVQGVRPEAAHLQLGDGSRFTVRLADVASYARHARVVFGKFLEERPETRSDPVSSCALCRWKDHCRGEWERTDSLSLVAGITKSQRGKFEAAGVTTLTGLATIGERVPKLSADTQDRLRTQARLQMARRAGGLPGFELRDYQPGKGFGLLPEPDDGDLFYDIEGDPYYDGGLEYLHGVWFRQDGDWTFRAFWAHDREAEGRSVADLLDFFVEHLRRHPRARIYHYANYEIAALRRLTAEHRVGEAAMDQLQRERRFVDLFKVVAGSLIASEKGYSIKDLEAFYMEKRDADVASAGASVVFYENWRETGDDELLAKIYDYNRTDCISTQLLRDWLVRDVRPGGMPWPQLGEVPDGGALSNVDVEDAEMETLRQRLQPVRLRLGNDVADLLLDLAFFHKREDKPAWWAIFDRLAQESEELVDDLDCIQGLVAVGPPVKVTAKSFERTYSFPLQETKLRAGKKPCVKPAAMPEDVDLRQMDAEAGVLVLRRSTAKGPLPDTLDLIPSKPIANGALRTAIAAVIDEIIGDTGLARAVEQLLTRQAPSFDDGPRPGGIVDPDGDLPTQTSAAIAAMDRTTLAIQGPPGTGKTYVSALSIVDLVRAGKRVAVSSNSHKAIGNLLEAIATRAASESVNCRVVQKAADDGDDDAHPGIVLVSDNDAPEIAAAHVVGATAWHFARYAAPAFDYLFVDEAGQVSLANILAMSRATRNLVLVGDPMQLPQPLQGTHPGRSGESCLEYLIDGHRVVPGDRGVFMPVSRRMHPAVCSFISRAVYEDRLLSDDAAARQDLCTVDGVSLVGAGVRPVPHLGRSQVSPEEIEAIRAQIAKVVGSTYRARDGVERIVGHGDILVVAPYNAQVNALRTALPAAVRVGTVDRFQGQEAPVCLVSMTTSSGEELPRDIAFLFSLNRINVAVSRAQVSAVVFASPLLLEIQCRTVPEMMLVNALCMLREHGGDSF
jgi:predicted RecB family nuclease